MNLVGQRFGRLTVKKFTGQIGAYLYGWRCVCECGQVVVVRQDSLRNERTQSCGCFREDNPNRLTHGDARKGAKAKEFVAWQSMKRRCYNPNAKDFRHYGGRGITLCKRWFNSYENFLKDVGRAPGPEFTIDRKNVNGNYTPKNCRWATRQAQSENRRCCA